MRVEYGKISKALRDANIYFTVKGENRFKENDQIEFSENCEIEPHTGFLGGAALFSMGAFSYTWSSLPLGTTVGRYCSIARGVSILGARHPMERMSTSSFTYDNSFVIFKSLVESEGSSFKIKPRPKSSRSDNIHIGHDVWIGANVTLKPGITIGTGSVIAASSVVVKDVPPYSIVGGNPAKIIKQRFDPGIVNALLSSEWWSYKFTDFSGMDIESPLEFSANMRDAVRSKKIEQYRPDRFILKDHV
ncbi:CatB-related O-acetyltransferase [Pseudomonas fulva]|uniref:CatB-related O-acetyltransferase n=1 Tax=Pseudomonas fulva TaxID=47880 RepID=UPI001E5D3827|nr:CatB-related O-acetyltransferase [Pseudomonas fulva]